MTGSEFKQIREALGMSATAFGLALGYSGKPENVRLTIHRYESRQKIPPRAAERAQALIRRRGLSKLADHATRKSPS